MSELFGLPRYVRYYIAPEQQILIPRRQALEAGETHARPQHRNLIVHEARVHAVKVLSETERDPGSRVWAAGEGGATQNYATYTGWSHRQTNACCSSYTRAVARIEPPRRLYSEGAKDDQKERRMN